MPQTQIAANPCHQEEEKKDTHTKKKNKKKKKKTYTHKTNKQMYENHKDQLPLPQARWSEC